jgi:porin
MMRLNFLTLSLCSLTYSAALMAQEDTAVKAYEPGLTWKGSAWYGVTGGEEFEGKGSGMQNIDATLTVDGDAAWGWGGTTVFAYVLSNLGSKPGAAAETMQGVDNIEVPNNETKLYQLWIQKNWADDRFSFLVGLFDLNSEFDVSEPAGMFLNPSFGISPEFSGTGANGPSIFPVTSLAMRIRWEASDAVYVQGAIFDAAPGDLPDHPERTSLNVEGDDGALLAGETGYRWAQDHGDNYGKLALGYWRYTEKVTTHAGDDEDVSQGWYLLAQHPLMTSAQDPEKGLAVFARLGFANEDVDAFANSVQLGGVWQAPAEGWEHGSIGLGVTRATQSEGAGDESETAYEITYHHQCTDHFAAQLDLQHITQTVDGFDNATALGLRLQYDL